MAFIPIYILYIETSEIRFFNQQSHYKHTHRRDYHLLLAILKNAKNVLSLHSKYRKKNENN